MGGFHPPSPSFCQSRGSNENARRNAGHDSSGSLGRRLGLALLGSSLLSSFVLRRSEDLHRTASLLDRLDRRLGGAVDFDGDLGLQLTAAKQAHAALGTAQHAGLHQRLSVDRALGIDLLVIDGFLQAVQVHFRQFDAEDVVESALRQAAMQRHLAAFKTLDAHARTRGLALAAAAGLLAFAGPNATADAHALLARAFVVGALIELDCLVPYFSSTTRTRC